MKIGLPFGDKEIILKIPNNWEIIIPDIPKINTLQDEVSIVKRSLATPHKQVPIRDTYLKNKRILIVIDDNTRPTPIHKFFHLILDELKKAGAKEENITVITALGIHTKMTHREIEEKIGRENLKYIKWKNHDAYNEEENVFIGKTSLGLNIELNREILKSDYIVLLGMIEPHLWAGYGGGMKLIFPGLGSARSISQHHMLISWPPYEVNRVGYDPDKNSFRLQLEEVYKLLNKNIFMVNVLLTNQNRIINCISGHPIYAHREGVRICREISGIKIPKKADGIIVSSHPMDINLKQGMKGVANNLQAVKKNGVIMGFLYAKKGIDDISLPDKSLPLPILRLLLKILGKKRIWKFVEKISANKNPEEKFLTYYTVNLIADYQLFVHAPTISREETKKLGVFENFYKPQQVIDKGTKKLGKNPLVMVFKEAGATFSFIEK